MTVEWKCPSCLKMNVDTRVSFVVCVHCASGYDSIPAHDVRKQTARDCVKILEMHLEGDQCQEDHDCVEEAARQIKIAFDV
jgi:hypothetical protein